MKIEILVKNRSLPSFVYVENEDTFSADEAIITFEKKSRDISEVESLISKIEDKVLVLVEKYTILDSEFTCIVDYEDYLFLLEYKRLFMQSSVNTDKNKIFISLGNVTLLVGDVTNPIVGYKEVL
jgi:hypothetical protein